MVRIETIVWHVQDAGRATGFWTYPDHAGFIPVVVRA
jgi:hypothetical protein